MCVCHTHTLTARRVRGGLPLCLPRAPCPVCTPLAATKTPTKACVCVCAEHNWHLNRISRLNFTTNPSSSAAKMQTHHHSNVSRTPLQAYSLRSGCFSFHKCLFPGNRWIVFRRPLPLCAHWTVCTTAGPRLDITARIIWD